MVAEMKPAYNEDNAEEGRSLRSRRVNYVNEKTAIKKKIKSCRED